MRDVAKITQAVAPTKNLAATKPDMRTQIIEAAIRELSVNGPEFFDTSKICRELFIARSLINHHFGNQTNLIAEASVNAYERYVLFLRASANSKETAEDRLEAWMAAQASWYEANRGIAVIHQLPHPRFVEIVGRSFNDRMQKHFRFNMSVLTILVQDVANQTISDISFEVDDAPYENLTGDISNVFRAGTIGMSVLGSSIWSAGRNHAERDLPERYLEDAAITQHHKWLIKSIQPKL